MTSPPNFACIGLLYHPKLPQTRVMVAEMLEFLDDFGVVAWVGESWDASTVRPRIAETDVLITLGGDGSMLRAARMALGHQTAVLGVNMGRLGFLAEIQPAEWPARFEQMLTQPTWVEERLMLQAEHWRDEQQQGHYLALNDVVVGRGGPAHVVRLKTFINHSYLTTYTADGMILSTPTGSTAYALAAGGPILPPQLKNYLLLPIAPHLSLERAIVLSEGDTVRLDVATHHQAFITVDGQHSEPLHSGDRVQISVSKQVSRFLRLQDQRYFYQTLMQRLGWHQAD